MDKYDKGGRRIWEEGGRLLGGKRGLRGSCGMVLIICENVLIILMFLMMPIIFYSKIHISSRYLNKFTLTIGH